MTENLTIGIADVSVEITGGGTLEIAPSYRPFVGTGKADISLCLHQGDPATLVGEKVFDCPPIWTLYRQNGDSIIKIFDTLPDLRRTLVLQPHFEKGDLYLADKSGSLPDPFYGPTMELLMLNYLAQGRGVVIHGCGIAGNGRGLLFVGESGAGKSTLARMWAGEPGVEVLSDDRIIVRKRGHQFWMYGTPWHGEASFASRQGLKLQRIFFLEHGHENSIKEIKGIDAILQLLTCSFPPHWDPQGMGFVLDMLSDVKAQVPCHELEFRPERSAIDFIKDFDGRG